MSDKNNDHEEEYFFPDEQDQEDSAGDDFFSELIDEKEETHTESDFEHESDEESGSNSLVDQAKGFVKSHFRIVITLAVVVVVLIGFSIFSGHSSDSNSKAAKAVTVPAQQTPAQQPIRSVQTVNDNQQVQAMQGSVQQNQAQLSSLQSQVSSVAAKQSQTSQTLQQLTAQIQQLTSTTQQLVAEVKILKARAKTIDAKKQYLKTHFVRYHVQAMEPGRAWLMGSNGLTTTVVVGQKLPHYGKVLEINVDHGTVVTSSGEKIVYRK